MIHPGIFHSQPTFRNKYIIPLEASLPLKPVAVVNIEGV